METPVVLTVEGVAVHGTSLRQIEAGTVHQHQEAGQAGTAARPRPTRHILAKLAHQIIAETHGDRHRIGNTPDLLRYFNNLFILKLILPAYII